MNAGRGVRGFTLAWFLRTYFGRRSVGIVSPTEMQREAPAADTVFVGLPSSLTADGIDRLFSRGRHRRVVLFDYLDQQGLAWLPEQEAAFCSVGSHYLKPWMERAWDYGLKVGMLPIRRSTRLTAAVAIDRALHKLGRTHAKKYDVAFLGQPNDTRIVQNGQVRIIDQRYNWLAELYDHRSEFNFWGGFVGGDPRIVQRLTKTHGDFSHLYYNGGRVSFPRYFRAMQQSRVLLAPGGNAPWTYRHYECLYAGGVVVTIDFRQRDLLVPLPTEGVVQVPDGALVVPYIRDALALSRERPTVGEQDIAHLEQYLSLGNYSRTRPKLIERFITQLQ